MLAARPAPGRPPSESESVPPSRVSVAQALSSRPGPGPARPPSPPPLSHGREAGGDWGPGGGWGPEVDSEAGPDAFSESISESILESISESDACGPASPRWIGADGDYSDERGAAAGSGGSGWWDDECGMWESEEAGLWPGGPCVGLPPGGESALYL